MARQKSHESVVLECPIGSSCEVDGIVSLCASGRDVHNVNMGR